MAQSRSFKQELVGVFGYPVAENPTQAMIEPAFADLGLDWRYLTVEVHPEDLGDAVRGIRAMNWKGFNCTIPHKRAVIPHLDALNPAAEIIGAVNCVIRRDSTLIGDNTDGKGFLQALTSVSPVAGKRVVILGAGGAARAIAVELALAGVRSITVVNRSRAPGEELAELIRKRTDADARFVPWEGKYPVQAGTDVLVQATSLGLFPRVDDIVPVEESSLIPNLIVCDVIPNPPSTRLLEVAAGRGCTTLDGLGMLVNQGVIGVQLWTGLLPRSDVMRRALMDVFRS